MYIVNKFKKEVKNGIHNKNNERMSKMRVRKKLKWIIAFFTCMIMALGCSIAVQAASYTPAAEYDGLSSQVKSNCVAFARYKVPSLPGGLWSLNDKKAIINSSKPVVGSIAITEGNSSYGHVAYVEAVNGNMITTLNGGYGDGSRIFRIVSTPAEQKVLGYWVPNGISTPTVSITWSGASAQDLGGGNYKFSISANSNVSGSYTEAGFTVYNEAGGVVAKHSEKTSISGTRLNIWNDLKADTGVTLKSGTNYKYQFYAIFNGKRYNGPTKAFKTSGKTANEWVDNLHITDWVYGKTASVPSASAKYGNVEFSYSSKADGEYTKTVPTNAGTYYVKAQVKETSTYTGLSAVKEFHIIKAVPAYTLPKDLKATYGQKLSEIQLPKGFAWLDDTVSVGDVGEKQFKVSYVPEDTTNYFFLKGLDVSVTVEPKNMSDIKLENIDENTDLQQYEIKDGEKILVKDKDYTIETIKGKTDVIVKVTFKGNYKGIVQTTYSVKENDNQEDDQKEESSGSQENDQKEEPNGNQNNDQKEEKPNVNQKDSNSKNDKKTNNTQDGAKELQKTKSPKTGDDALMEMYTIMTILFGAVIMIIGGKKLKK